MQSEKVLDLTLYRKKKDDKKRPKRSKTQNKGRIYSRGNKLWVDFYYLGERVREPSGLDDTALNRKNLRIKLNSIVAKIDNGEFSFPKIFPHSKKKNHFAELEGQLIRLEPQDITFQDYYSKWFSGMNPGMSPSQIQDYTTIVKCHILPTFGELPLSEFWKPLRLKRFIQDLKAKKNRYDEPLSGKRIRNIMIPLRVIVRDAIEEHGWHEYYDPFANLKLPKARKFRIFPFNFEEWSHFMQFIPDWYNPYFEFAVQTGLRPSEQVALKWSAIDEEFIHIELSRVDNRVKADLKTEESRRSIEIRQSMRDVLETQRQMTKHFDSPYVFVNTQGNPVNQGTLSKQWRAAMLKSNLRYRRMYETRHTFASWALAAGETPEWVAKTLGHVNSSMIYKTYGRYIPNLTRKDGSAFERLYSESANKKGNSEVDTIGHNHGHNRE